MIISFSCAAQHHSVQALVPANFLLLTQLSSFIIFFLPGGSLLLFKDNNNSINVADLSYYFSLSLSFSVPFGFIPYSVL